MSELRGIRRLKLAVGEPAEGEAADCHHIIYYRINLAELTLGSLRGEKYEEWLDEKKGIPRTREHWTWENLARWLLCIEVSSPPPNRAEIDALRQLFRDDPRNSANLHLLDDPISVPSYVPTASDKPGEEPIATREPTIIYLREDALARSGFQHWYRRRLLFGVASTFPGKEISYFDDFRTNYIKPLIAGNQKVQSQVVKPIAKLLAQLQLGETLYSAMFVFAEPAGRAAAWRRGGAPDSRGEESFVVPIPEPERMSAVRLDAATWTELTRELTEISRWQLAHGKEGRARDANAKALLERLRDPAEPLVQMLAQPLLLSPEEHFKLRTLLADSMSALARSPWACDELMKGEFAAIAHAASESPATAPFEPKTARERSLKKAIESFDSRALLPIAAPSAFTDSILNFFKAQKAAMGDAKEAFTNLGIGLDLLAVATPFVHHALFVPKTGVVNEAWLWRSLVGVSRMSPKAQHEFWIHVELAKMGSSPGIFPVRPRTPLLEVDSGALAQTLSGLSSNVAWKTAKLLATVLVASQAVAEFSDKTPEEAIAGLSAMMSTIKAGADLVTLDPQKCFLLSRYTTDSQSVADLTRAVDKTRAVELLGPVADGLAFAAAALEFRDSASKQSALTREQKTEALILDGLTFAVSAIGFAVGSELAIASFAIYLAQAALFNRNVWDFVLPGAVRAPGPQQFLRKVLHTVDDDEFVGRLRLRGRLGATKGEMSMAAFDKRLGSLLESLNAPVEDSNASRRYWDLGGTPGTHVDGMAKGILKDYYGFNAEARSEIVLPSNEVEWVGQVNQ